MARRHQACAEEGRKNLQQQQQQQQQHSEITTKSKMRSQFFIFKLVLHTTKQIATFSFIPSL
jgi:hypothetical protein